ncbi:50S ribosomal protein L4 [Candidatus Trichorickettsia mobilis]|uniref:50S ribosomal protein L4 n=1 Tax=Candidatus Trichorickettsia mobilis TaxID=1346319 RepID=UPI00292DD820|nr:50S ribosomal protein L4 [Candidatus Trichorickettsia mobilis]
MKAKVVNLDNQVVGERVLDTNIFNLEPRVDIIKLVVDWQRAKKMAGTHSTKTVSEVSGTTRKPFKQKGTGNARQGSLRSVHMRGGGVIHGPVVRSHATKLPKKVRKLGLKHALSSKLAEGKLIILESLILENSKTSSLVAILKNFQGKSFFVIDGNLVNDNFAFAVRNIPNISVVPQIGANVYDIISHDCILVSQAAVDALEERLK